MTIRAALLLPVLAVPAFAPQEALAPRYERVHALRSDEGIFAYARVTPDGRYMAYASQERDTRDFSPVRIINVVDLRRHEVVYTEPGIDAYWSNDGTRMIYTGDRKSTRLNSSHSQTSYAVFCLKKKTPR